jgi:hypothetical protein
MKRKNFKEVNNYFYKVIKSNIPKHLSVSGLPELNHFQMNAVKKALITPLCLI